MYGAQTLIVVYKDEIYINQLRKLVETKDDAESDVIGTQDGSIQIVAWDEKTWLTQKRAGNITNKVLFIGDIKGVDSLIPIIDIRFNEYGVKYGWAGNQAAVWIDVKALSKEDYIEFLTQFNVLPVPEQLKIEVDNNVTKQEEAQPVKQGFWNQVVSFGANALHSAKELLKDKTVIKKQMFFYGIIKLYFNDLEKFMNS